MGRRQPQPPQHSSSSSTQQSWHEDELMVVGNECTLYPRDTFEAFDADDRLVAWHGDANNMMDR